MCYPLTNIIKGYSRYVQETISYIMPLCYYLYYNIKDNNFYNPNKYMSNGIKDKRNPI